MCKIACGATSSRIRRPDAPAPSSELCGAHSSCNGVVGSPLSSNFGLGPLRCALPSGLDSCPGDSQPHLLCVPKLQVPQIACSEPEQLPKGAGSVGAAILGSAPRLECCTEAANVWNACSGKPFESGWLCVAAFSNVDACKYLSSTIFHMHV